MALNTTLPTIKYCEKQCQTSNYASNSSYSLDSLTAVDNYSDILESVEPITQFRHDKATPEEDNHHEMILDQNGMYSDSEGSDLSLETLWDDDFCKFSSENMPITGIAENKPDHREAYQIKTYRELVEILQAHPNSKKSQTDILYDECKNHFRFNLSTAQKELLKNKILNFCSHYNRRWSRNNRTKIRFETREKDWLDNYLIVPQNWFELESKVTKRRKKSTRSTSNEAGPSRIPGQCTEFLKLGTRGQEKAVQKMTQKFDALPTPVILRSTRQVLTKRNQKSASLVLKELEKSPTRPKKILERYKQPQLHIQSFTTDEALAIMIQLKLSVSSYKFLRTQMKNRKCDIFPSYHLISSAKLLCRPSNITVNEITAKVPLQDLLNHTAKRLVESHKEPILVHLMSGNEAPMYTLVGIYGFDGSSGHSMYNQKFENGGIENTLFATTFIPMRLVSVSGFVLWQNPTPQSIRFCRPIKLEFVKETIQKIQMERDEIATAIHELIPFIIQLENVQVRFNFDLRLTAIDGKALQAITEITKSTQACPLCGCNPSEFNNLCNLQNGKFEAKTDVLVHGVSPLHCWIRFFEFCLKLAYRKPAGVYPVSSDDAKTMYAETKKSIQQNLRSSLGILVDVVKPGAGTTNNGNIARKAFENHQIFARILNIDQEFVRALHIILVTIASQFAIKSEEFGEYCLRTMQRYVSIYHWHPLSATLHRVLVHVEGVIENSILPLGLMGEDAAESRNRLHRHDREFHARQMGRVVNLQDVFHRALESSDPMISSHFVNCRKNLRQRLSLPSEVQGFLEDPVESSVMVQGQMEMLLSATKELQEDNSFTDTLDNLELNNDEDDDQEPIY